MPRKTALAGLPVRVPPARVEELRDGRTGVTVLVPTPGWVRWIGGPKQVERTFRLDSLGKEVYDACDGETAVRAMIRNFARTHRVSQAEAEMAVTTFLKTLIVKGLVAVAVDRKSK